jgi:acyl-CoA thioesterase-1
LLTRLNSCDGGALRPAIKTGTPLFLHAAQGLVVGTLLACPVAVQAAPIDIVAIGDSNTNGDGIIRASAWPAQLEKSLRAKGYDVRVHNAGASGDTTGEALARLDRAVPEGTDAAIVFLGRNDKRFHAPMKLTRRNIDEIVKRLRGRDIAVLLIGFENYDFGDIADAHGAAYYPDFFAGVTRNGKKLRRYVLPLDPIRHLNPSGHAVIAERLLPSVELLVQRINR